MLILFSCVTGGEEEGRKGKWLIKPGKKPGKAALLLWLISFYLAVFSGADTSAVCIFRVTECLQKSA